jgi:hypothetical protein
VTFKQRSYYITSMSNDQALPIPATLLEDQDIYAILDNLFTNTDLNVTNIENTIKSIGAARQYYDDFSGKMDEYIRYESMIDARLEQLKNFVDDESLINMEQLDMNALDTKITTIASSYATIVDKNNTTARDINTQYNVVKDKLILLATQSARVYSRMGDFNRLISTKRAANYVNTKTILLKVMSGSYTNDNAITFDAIGLSSGPNFFTLGHNFTLNAARQLIVYGGFPSFSTSSPKVSVTINIEMLSTISMVMDTTTKFAIHHAYIDGDGAPKDTYYEITSLSKPPLTLIMSPNDTLEIKPKTSIVITTSMFTLSIANVPEANPG